MSCQGQLQMALGNGKPKKYWADLTASGLFWASKKGGKVVGQAGVTGCNCQIIDGKPFTFGLFAAGSNPPQDPKVLMRANDMAEMTRWMQSFRDILGGREGTISAGTQPQGVDSMSSAGVGTQSGTMLVGSPRASAQMKVVRVYTKDGAYKSLAAKPETTVLDLCQQFAEKLRLGAHVQNFALKEVTGPIVKGSDTGGPVLAGHLTLFSILDRWAASGWSNPVSDSEKFRLVFGFTEEVIRRQTLRLQEMKGSLPKRPAPPVPARKPPGENHPQLASPAMGGIPKMGMHHNQLPKQGTMGYPGGPAAGRQQGTMRQPGRPGQAGTMRQPGRPGPAVQRGDFKPPVAKRPAPGRGPGAPKRRGPAVPKRMGGVPKRPGGVPKRGPAAPKRGPPVARRAGPPPTSSRTASPVTPAQVPPPTAAQQPPSASDDYYGSLPEVSGSLAAAAAGDRPFGSPPPARATSDAAPSGDFYGAIPGVSGAQAQPQPPVPSQDAMATYGATSSFGGITPVAVPVVSPHAMVTPVTAATKVTPVVAPHTTPITPIVAPVTAPPPASQVDEYVFESDTNAGYDDYDFQDTTTNAWDSGAVAPYSTLTVPPPAAFTPPAASGEEGDEFDDLISNSFLLLASGAATPLSGRLSEPSEPETGAPLGDSGFAPSDDNGDELMAFLASELDGLMDDLDNF